MLRKLPLLSVAGCLLSLFAASACVASDVLASSERLTVLVTFVGCAMLAVLGLWADWARLYRPTARTMVVSGAALGATVALAALSPVALTPSLLIGLALGVLVRARVLWWLGTRGRSAWRVIVGDVRVEERDRWVLAGDEIVELDRDGELGPRRTVEAKPGAPLAVLGCFEPLHAPSPYRGEVRLRASRVAAVGDDVKALRRGLFTRARSWALYLCALALLTTAIGTYLAPARPAPPCSAFTSYR